ncbi:kinase-like domain-containing protein [Hypoxylon sp. NC1633]|nr:kinase-like domain-containing protein [Hypoxylon sp. NC1633]
MSSSNNSSEYELPRTYEDDYRLAALQFHAYRQEGKNVFWTEQDIHAQREVWKGLQLPRTVQTLFEPRKPYKSTEYPVEDQDEFFLDEPGWVADNSVNQARDAVVHARQYFDTITFQYQKALGFGGFGLALHYKYLSIDGARDLVIKLSLLGWESRAIRKEEDIMRRLLRAAHCVQLIGPESLGQLPRSHHSEIDVSDSSDEKDSSGDESVTGAPPPRRQKARTPQSLRAALERTQQRAADYQQSQAGQPPRPDYLIMEYVAGGSLETLIGRCVEVGQGVNQRIPNRVLWSIWLCLVRACVAMKYPPRKFHPNRLRHSRPTGREDLIETVPGARRRWRAKNIVHFDIDPTNIFIGDFEVGGGAGSEQPLRLPRRRKADEISDSPAKPKTRRRRRLGVGRLSMSQLIPEDSQVAHALMSLFGMPRTPNAGSEASKSTSATPGTGTTGSLSSTDTSRPERREEPVQPDREPGEHILFPRLKLADYGLAKEVKTFKRNTYYFYLRRIGKLGFMSPEQFTSEWDTLPPTANGSEVSEHPTAGSYGSATNIWGIAVTMWILITQRLPPTPPQPQVPPGVVLPPGYDANSASPGSNPQNTPEYKAALAQLSSTMPISYCVGMDNSGNYTHVDEELREVIYRCMYHSPEHRPTIEDLLEQAQRGLQKVFDNEPDDVVNRWVDDFLLSAPT